jgi:hypothetical protein
MKDKFEIIEDENLYCGTTTLTKEQFRDFITFLNIIRNDFIDLWINNGVFRARSNDHTCVVESGFSYFENITFFIANIPLIIKVLSALDKNTEINITVDETDILFDDGDQSISIKKASHDFADNPFVQDKEMEEIFYENIDNQKPLICETLPKAVVSNINKMAQDLNTESICVRHNKGDLNKGNLYVGDKMGNSSESSVNFCTYSYKLKETFLNPMKHNYYFTLNSHPFVFNKSDMIINCYLSNSHDIIMTIYTVVVGKLLINIYGRSPYRESDE